MADKEIVRPLTAGEAREAHWMFGGNLNAALTHVHRGRWAFWQPDDTAMSPDGDVYFPEPIYRADFSANASDMGLLVHELTHVWQIQSGVHLKFWRLMQGGVYDYGRVSPSRKLQSYTIEQQASIVGDWYRLRHRLAPEHGSGAAADYEAAVRAAIPVGK